MGLKKGRYMANTSQTKGFCKYCGKEYTKTGMLRHLAACKKRKARLDEESRKTRGGYYQVVISGKYNKSYWLILEISENTTLKELDQFIRDIWVECCGHLSSFKINGELYDVHPDADSFWGPPAKNMNYRLRDVFSVGEIAAYEYDFGSTTELELKVHSYRIGERSTSKITILSRNNPLGILCCRCGKNEAEWINPQRYYEEDTFWCENCLHEAYMDEVDPDEVDDPDEFDDGYIFEPLLPVCNSPRMGVCGYEGSNKCPDQFEPDEK